MRLKKLERERIIFGGKTLKGTEMLERIGSMRVINEFCRWYPAYKHDDVFNLEYSVVFVCREEQAILSQIAVFNKE